MVSGDWPLEVQCPIDRIRVRGYLAREARSGRRTGLDLAVQGSAHPKIDLRKTLPEVAADICANGGNTAPDPGRGRPDPAQSPEARQIDG